MIQWEVLDIEQMVKLPRKRQRPLTRVRQSTGKRRWLLSRQVLLRAVVAVAFFTLAVVGYAAQSGKKYIPENERFRG
jgi:hypothetical protein